MKTATMLLNVAATVVLSTVAYATCATEVDMGNNKIVNVANPTASQDVVNKRYLEAYLYEAMEKRFVRDNTKQVVLDLTTNLMWQDDAAARTVTKPWITQANYNAGDYYNTTGDTATTYCTNLTLGGFSNWRLPTQEELFAIVKDDVLNPSISPIFQNTASYYYWSSTTYVNDISYARIVNFSTGVESRSYKAASLYVRCVRAGQ